MHTYCTRNSSRVGSDIKIGSWSVNIYRMSMYASANSCVDRLNTEGSKDPASRLTQTADKRRERATLAETDNQMEERLMRKQRDRSRHSTQTANGRDENLSA